MKIRNGFVSNSSSSSFLIVGIEKSKLTEEQIKLAEDNELEQCGYDEGDRDYTIIGREWHIDEYVTKEFALSQINDVAKKIQSVLGEKAVAQLFVGSRYS